MRGRVEHSALKKTKVPVILGKRFREKNSIKKGGLKKLKEERKTSH